MDDYSELVNPRVIAPIRLNNLVLPPGYNEEVLNTKKSTLVDKKQPDNLEELKIKKVWEIAIGPAKAIPMNLIMSYMTGSSLQIIPIMMTFSLLLNPLKAIFNDTNRIFKSLETDTNSSIIIQAKALFVVCHLGCMAIGVWKLNSMGLIPNSEADWLSFKSIALTDKTVVV